MKAASVRSTTIGTTAFASRPLGAFAFSTTEYRPSGTPVAVNLNDCRPAFFCSANSVASVAPDASRSVAVTVDAMLTV